MKLTYCSFAIPGRCLGVVLLRGHMDPIQASLLCHVEGINPGGELMSFTLDTDEPECPLNVRKNMEDPANQHRLVPLLECIELFETRSLGEQEVGSN